MKKSLIKKTIFLAFFLFLNIAAFFLVTIFSIFQIIVYFFRRLYRVFKRVKKKLQHLLKQIKRENNNGNQKSAYAPLHVGRQKALDEILIGELIPPMTKKEVIIDMSIVTYNSHKHFKSLFESIKKQTYPTRLINLIFVDSCSTDNVTIDELYLFKQENEQLFHGITILPLKKNIGFGRSHNHGFELRKGTFFLVTNPDLEFEKHAIEKIVHFALLDDLSKVASWEFRQKPYEHPKYYDPITLKTFWSSGACLLINPKAFEQVGGYNKHIFMYGEDVELSYHFIDAGWDLKYCPFSVVWHYTYEKADEVKPAQFMGSLSANGLLKLRYGNLKEIVESIFQFPYLIFREIIKVHRSSTQRCRLIFSAYFIYLRLAAIFLCYRKTSARVFPFSNPHYLIARHGAFYNHNRQEPNLNSTTPLVSIIMRIHGDQIPFLRESVASVLRQTYLNIELITVEDGGTCAKNFMEEVISKAPQRKIKYFSLSKQGRSATGNVGLSEATGELMMFLDSDDYLYPDHVEILTEELQANVHIDIVYSLAWEVTSKLSNEKDGTLVPEDFSYTLLPTYLKNFSFEALRENNLFPIQSPMFRRSVYEKCGGFDTRLEYLEDWNLWLRYADYFNFKQIFKLTSCYRVSCDKNIFNKRASILKKARSLALKCYEDKALNSKH